MTFTNEPQPSSNFQELDTKSAPSKEGSLPALTEVQAVSKPELHTTKSLADKINAEAAAKGKLLKLPHQGGTLVLGAFQAQKRASELRNQQEQQSQQ